MHFPVFYSENTFVLACRIYGFVGGLSGTVSIVTLSAISFDRYFVIKFPLNRAYSNLRIKICLIVIWLYGTTFSLIPALDIGFGEYTYEGYLTSCSFDYLSLDKYQRYFILVFFIAAWVVPFVLITFSYANILRIVVTRSSSNKTGRDSFRHVKVEDNKKQEIKLAFVVLSTICLWFLSWTPYAVIALLGIFDQKHLITPLSSMIPAIFCKTASCINPFIYALSHPKFKLELRNMLSCRVQRRCRRDTNKIWSTQSSKVQNFDSGDKDLSDVEVEVVQFERGTIPMQPSPDFKEIKEEKNTKKKLKREISMVEMLCLRPTFSNKSSTIRKLTRRWSSKEREKRKSEED
ncbi:hypothetical protein NQ314_013413 [Rhamnusium bicolor]|uniref:G-protein coupled receptors family 1 profile domain-containing protein n=1 Tax=Rhamnusium bicolor TaxID=1586634 RepID=A0AAV8X6F6_9CUCU|nr:hypothetical protein NQ314_013413 [Rhamnusium bicolor]